MQANAAPRKELGSLSLCEAANPEIQGLKRTIVLEEADKSEVILKVGCNIKYTLAKVLPSRVGWQPVLSTSLDVQRGQVHARGDVCLEKLCGKNNVQELVHSS